MRGWREVNVYVTRLYIAVIDFYILYMQSVLGAPDTFSPHHMASCFNIQVLNELVSVLCHE